MEKEVIRQALFRMKILFKSAPNYGSCGEWSRFFILDSRRLSVGRILFKNNKVYSIKNYNTWTDNLFHETDFIFFRINVFINHGYDMSLKEYEDILSEAQRMRIVDLAKKKEWRDEHPKENKRPPQKIMNEEFDSVGTLVEEAIENIVEPIREELLSLQRKAEDILNRLKEEIELK